MKPDRFRIGAAAASLILATLLLASALDWWLERRSSLATSHRRLAELKARRLHARDVEHIRGALAAAPDPQTGLLAAVNDTDAMARLEAIIRTAAASHEAEVVSLVPATAPAEQGLRAVRASVQFTVANESLGSLVRTLEAGPPVLFLERLRVTQRPSAETPERPTLDVAASVLIYGEALAPGRSGP